MDRDIKKLEEKKNIRKNKHDNATYNLIPLIILSQKKETKKRDYPSHQRHDL